MKSQKVLYFTTNVAIFKYCDIFEDRWEFVGSHKSRKAFLFSYGTQVKIVTCLHIVEVLKNVQVHPQNQWCVSGCKMKIILHKFDSIEWTHKSSEIWIHYLRVHFFNRWRKQCITYPFFGTMTVQSYILIVKIPNQIANICS